MRERVWRYSMQVSVAGVVLAAAGLVTGIEPLYWIGLLLALPALVVYAVLAVFLVVFFVGSMAVIAVLIPLCLAAEAWSRLTTHSGAAPKPTGD